jgi:hypothetical protein
MDYYKLESPSYRLISAEAIFPTLSAILSICALLLTITVITLTVIEVFRSIDQPPELIFELLLHYLWITIPIEPLFVLGFSLGFASLIAGNPRKLGAIIGVIVGGALATLGFVVMLVPDSAFPPL